MAPSLGLDLKLSASKIITKISNEASSIGDDAAKIAKLDAYVADLEEERRKIEVFKRELPLCMFLLDDVIDGLKAELEQCRRARRHVLEEFMPVNSKLEDERRVKVENDCKDKMNWMSSAQLWSDNYSGDADDDNKNGKKSAQESANESDHLQESETPSFESKSRTLSGAFVPFKGLPAFSCCSKREDKITGGLPDLSLVPLVPIVPEGAGAGAKTIASCQLSSPSSSHQSSQAAAAAAARKARRCWSPELHRRFVVALQQLGGASTATPKQIRELMKVDGLTNDEVKSHLQKYRLHTRRAPNSSSSSRVVVMGGLWGPPDHYSASGSQSGSPEGPLQLAGSSRAMSVTAGDSCDDDGKSESYGWK